MPVHIECDSCGYAHTIPERTFEPDTGGTSCPNCGARPYTVRRTELEWHLEIESR